MDKQHIFHPGEREAQDNAGEASIAARNAAMVSATVIAGARPFIAKQFMAALGSVDATGRLWASLVFGKPGFMHTGDGSAISFDIPAALRDPDDPLWSNIAHNKDLGMLFIELGSRRRYRVNGNVSRLDEDGMEVAIQEAYPNCPRYIQRRHLRSMGEVSLPARAARGRVLRGSVEDIVRGADTLFVASRHAGAGADASHRGGGVGFVHIVDESTLRIPDFNGNSMFNTFGNFRLDPRAGLCIPDFAGGRLLQLTGTGSVLWDQPDPGNDTGGTGRFFEFTVEQWILREALQPLEWEYLDASPFNPPVSA
ncbi:pyridoxamine 5'-phosphate oxidase family protein [Herbaspirillum sp. LeCh32-8]|uniref:pyridoxamine 5'-phosphate oxidase family protein n=1 Tax=Herbaspirillum sp. LeCh32-8 TaxID=2821356 RepID=UPI001AEB507B|nr:pyridoxamine 5'-phosphate oxidase family protein [Herbaspirillum sp. LeCh32-8]MBP0598738.1 pyridoxamine 5'-phosphate oxidase family protein [Herbaspirillum sp. LeCh32-8]